MTVKEKAVQVVEKLIPENNKILFDSANISVSSIRANCESRILKKAIVIEWEEMLPADEKSEGEQC